MKPIFLLQFLLVCMFFSSCINNIEDVSSGKTFDPSEVSYSADIQPIFTSSCGGYCHINAPTNGVHLSSYDNVMNSIGQLYGTTVVIPGEPEESPLVDKIESDNPEFGERMPRNGPPYLSNEEINKIKAWIEGGAEDN